MSRTRIPLSDCGLLSRDNARRFVGCLGDERFDREVGPHVTPRLIGKERFYRISELRAWIDSDRPQSYDDKADLLETIERVYGPQGSASPYVKGPGVLLSPGHG